MNKADIRMLDRMANAKFGDSEFMIDLPARWFTDDPAQQKLEDKRAGRIRVYVDLWERTAEMAYYKGSADIRTIEYETTDYRRVMRRLRAIYRQTLGRSWNIE